MTDPLRKRLEEVRHALLALHKALVDSERISYESTIGAIRSPNQFLQLLITDPWFAWLQPLSQLIVSMDEALDAKEQLTATVVDAAVKEAGVLLSLQTELSQDSSARPSGPAGLEIVPGSGLSILRDRTERLGGALELALTDDEVAVLRVEVPA